MKWGIAFIIASLALAGAWRVKRDWENAPQPWPKHMVTRLASHYWESRREALPPAFARFHAIGGVIEFHVFRDVAGDNEMVLAAIAHVLPGADTVRLSELGARVISSEVFFGDWHDPTTGRLVSRRRPVTTPADGGRLTVIEIPSPKPGSDGNFAYAFLEPPYSLHASDAEVQALYADITSFILPQNVPHEIRDWSSPELPGVHRYFKAGAEWWGVYLLTIYTPATRTLTVITASTTD